MGYTMSPYGIHIESIWHMGYTMSPYGIHNEVQLGVRTLF